MTIYYFLARYYSAAIVFLIFSVFYAACWFWWKSRIPFATVMLETVIDVTRRYMGTFWLAFGGLLVQTLYTVWWAFTVVGAYSVFYPQACQQTGSGNSGSSSQCSQTSLNLVIIFLIFSFYWTSQVIDNTVHVAVAGVFAHFYFIESAPSGERPPATGSPTLGSLKRAMTTSFGSICFGSLIIALIQTTRALLRAVAQDSDNGFAAFCAMCVECILGLIEGLVEYFNYYAYTQVAIYGKSFCQAAKDTWTLIKDRGVDAIINDNLIGNVLAMGAILIGMLTALFGFLFLTITSPSYNADGSFTPVVVLLAFIVGLQMMWTVSSVIRSGVATTFVALAEDPQALARTKPELFEKIRQTYPGVVWGV